MPEAKILTQQHCLVKTKHIDFAPGITYYLPFLASLFLVLDVLGLFIFIRAKKGVGKSCNLVVIIYKSNNVISLTCIVGNVVYSWCNV